MHLGSPLGTVENGVTNIHHKGAMMKLVPVQRSSETMRSLDPSMYIYTEPTRYYVLYSTVLSQWRLPRKAGRGGGAHLAPGDQEQKKKMRPLCRRPATNQINKQF